MRDYLSGAAMAAVLTAGGLGLGACAGPMWPASHGDVQTHVSASESQLRAADAETNARVASVDQAAQDAMARANAAQTSAQHPFNYSVVMKDDTVKFDSAKSDLSPDAQTFLTSFAEKLKTENQNVLIEIQGHGDSHGSKAYNRALGEKRADAVKRFLAAQGVPLPRMSTISYGEEDLKAPETSPEAHAANRRVVLVVMNAGPQG